MRGAKIQGGMMKRLVVLVHALAACVLLDFHRLRKMDVRYMPMVISGLIGNALRSAVAGAREPT
jgi:hypothetical protein